MGIKFKLINLQIRQYDYDKLYNETSHEDFYDYEEEEYVNLSNVPPLERKGLKVLAPNKLLTRLPILLAQIKAGNNSLKLKNETRQILYLLYHHSKITKKVYNNLIQSL